MRPVLFFVYLCSLLLTGGGHDAFAGIRQANISYTQSHDAEQKQQFTFSNTNQPCNIIKDLDLDKEDRFMVSDDVENEDTNDDVVAKKYKLPAVCQPSRHYASILSYLCKSVKAPVSSLIPVSYIYITQRALRI